MKALVVYYSRTNTTKRIADEIAMRLKADVAAIEPQKGYEGALGWLRAGREAGARIEPKIRQVQTDGYDLVVIGTPVWVGTMASPVRTFMKRNKLDNVAFFCTMGGGVSRTFDDMQKLSSEPKATLAIRTKDVRKGDYDLKDFVSGLKR